MSSWYRTAALSQNPVFRFLRSARRSFYSFTLPAPRVIFLPLLWLVLFLRSVYYFVMRVFICEPLFKAYCTSYGKNVHTGVFLHWIEGRGRIILGDNVLLDGKCSIKFAVRYNQNPVLEFGDNSGAGHNCTFVIAKRISIGKHCRLAGGIHMFDSPGHPMDPVARREGLPAAVEDVKEIVVGDNVWIGARATIFPGVTIGEGSVIGTGAVVVNDVPPYTLMMGNPARQVKTLAR